MSFDGIANNSNVGLDTVYKDEIINPLGFGGGLIGTFNRYDSKYANYQYLGADASYCGITTPSPCDTSFIQISCTDTTGNHKWRVLLGGEAGYTLTDVRATSDSGCILLAMRHPDSTYFNGQAAIDLYYCKLDRFGNVQSNYLPTSAGFYQLPIIKELILYPNPTRDMLYFKTEEIETYAVFDVQGARVLQGKYENGISMNNLSKGNYIIRARNKKDELFIGRFTKE